MYYTYTDCNDTLGEEIGIKTTVILNNLSDECFSFTEGTHIIPRMIDVLPAPGLGEGPLDRDVQSNLGSITCHCKTWQMLFKFSTENYSRAKVCINWM